MKSIDIYITISYIMGIDLYQLTSLRRTNQDRGDWTGFGEILAEVVRS